VRQVGYLQELDRDVRSKNIHSKTLIDSKITDSTLRSNSWCLHACVYVKMFEPLKCWPGLYSQNKVLNVIKDATFHYFRRTSAIVMMLKIPTVKPDILLSSKNVKCCQCYTVWAERWTIRRVRRIEKSDY